MIKYSVVVNQKYIVKVEANSQLGAEQIVLDLHGGIATAQAFDQEGMKTDTFEYFLNNCDFCSFKEIEQKTDEWYKITKEWNKTLDESISLETRIKQMKEEIEELQKELLQKKRRSGELLGKSQRIWE